MKHLIKICLTTLCVIALGKANAQTEVQFYTTKGNFTIMLTDTLTPRTVDSFLARVTQKFYDGLIFHRVINNFVIQGGDPLGNGTGGPGYTIPDEIVPSLTNVQGSLAMANAGPNTNGSQFYVNLVNNTALNGHYTVFGMTTTGFSVVQTIGAVPTNSSDKPLTNVYMDSIRVIKFPVAVSSISNGININIYPNPSRGQFTIDLPKTHTKVEIVNMGGQIVYSAEAKRSLKVDMRDKPTGLYIVRTSNKDGNAESRLIVQ
jgi:cyclophilin family peptidyl-prolyl cis-trans isomerase